MGEHAHESRLGGAKRAEEQNVLTGENGGERAVDDGLPLGEQQQQLRPKGVDERMHDCFLM